MEKKMDIIDDAIAAIDRDGYAVIRRLVTGERLRRLQQDAEALLIPIEAKGVDGGSITGRMHKGTFGVSRAFDDIIIHPVLLDIVNGVLNPSRASEYPHDDELTKYITSLPPSDPGIICNIMIKDAAPREDIRSLHRDVRVPVPRPHQPIVCNSLLALDPFNDEVGATCVVPGSHNWESDETPDMGDAIPVVMDPGDIVVFDGLLWHGHGPNYSFDRNRRCLNLNYHYRWIPYFRNPRLSDEVWRDLPETLRAVV